MLGFIIKIPYYDNYSSTRKEIYKGKEDEQDERKNNKNQNRAIYMDDPDRNNCRINTSGELGRNRRYESGDIWGMATKTGICK